MIGDTAKMLADFESLLVIQSPVDEALAETARVHGCSIEQMRSAAAAKFGNLEEYAGKAGIHR